MMSVENPWSIRLPVPVDAAIAEDVRDTLAALGDEDPEGAHLAEDAFVRKVFQAIAEGHSDPVELARAALIVLDADYPRGFA